MPLNYASRTPSPDSRLFLSPASKLSARSRSRIKQTRREGVGGGGVGISSLVPCSSRRGRTLITPALLSTVSLHSTKLCLRRLLRGYSFLSDKFNYACRPTPFIPFRLVPRGNVAGVFLFTKATLSPPFPLLLLLRRGSSRDIAAHACRNDPL